MFAKRLILTNYGPHRRLDLSFDKGLVGIFGPNGAGKSYAVEAIPAAIDNDFGRFPGVKNDCIHVLAGPGEESSIYVEAEHNGQNFTLYRALRAPRGSPNNSLVIGDRKAITNSNEIARAIKDDLGLNSDVLRRYVFIPQWQMFAFLTETSGKRAEAYQALCGTERAAEICTAIDKMTKDEPDLFTEVFDTSDEWRTKVAQLTTAMATANADFESAMRRELPLDVLTLFQDRVETWQRRQTLLQQYNGEKAKLPTMTAATAQAETAAIAAADVHTRTLAALQTTQDVADQARIDLKDIQAVKVRQTARNRLRQQLRQARTALEAVVASPPHPSADRLADMKLDLRDKQTRLSDDKTTLQSSVCPTCKQPVGNVNRQALVDRIKKAEAEIVTAKAKITEIESVQASHNAAELRRSTAAQDVQALTGQLQAYADVSDEVRDEVELKAVVAAFDRVKSELTIAVRAHQTADRNHAVAKSALEDQKQRVSSLQTEGKSITTTKGQYDEAIAALAKHNEAGAQTYLLGKRRDELASELGDAEQSLQSILVRLERGRKARKFGADLRLIRDEIMHRQMLPRAVAQSNLQDMESTINHTLAQFGDPFWVSAADDLSFDVHFPGQPAVNAQRLSGGQKMVLALAFHSSVQSLFGADIGMMTLDEPTAGVDAENRQGIAQVLTHLASSVRGSKQIIVITHAEELTPCFDQIVRIGGPDA